MGDEDLRDLFAFGALQGMIGSRDWFANIGAWKSREQMFDCYAEEAYGFADAMLKERNRAYPTITPEEGGIAAVVKRTRKKHGEDS